MVQAPLDRETQELLRVTHPRAGLYACLFTLDENKNTRHSWWKTDEVSGLAVPREGLNVYYAVNSYGEKRRKNDCVSVVSALASDLDLGKVPGIDTPKDLVRYAFSHNPSTVILTGGGAQILHLLDKPYVITNEEERRLITELQYKWVTYTQGDQRSKDLARVQRVPGTQNIKYLPEVRYAEWVEARFSLTYRIDDLLDMVKDIELPNKTKGVANSPVGEKRIYQGLPFSFLIRDKVTEDDNKIAKALQREKAKDGEPKEVTVILESETKTYPSRSEGEKSLVSRLIIRGYTFEEGVTLFESWKPGHYIEQGTNRTKYLWSVWQEEEHFIANSWNRRQLARVIRDAEALPFPGRMGIQAKRVLVGILKQAYQMDTIAQPVAASLRELAEYAGITDNRTVTNSLEWLAEDPDFQLRVVAEEWKPLKKHYRKGRQYFYVFGLIQGVYRKWEKYGLEDSKPLERAPLDIQELWTPNYLGRSAGDLYPHLTEIPITEAELVRRTQKSRKAVRNGLHKLQEAGLAVKTSRGWVRGNATLEEAAKASRCVTQGDKRRKRHQADRA